MVNQKINHIIKITSGSNHKVFLLTIYKDIKASSIKAAEAAKVLKILKGYQHSFYDELSILFHKLDIDTNEVLNAASTKCNFIKYLQVLLVVSSVDPYYLSYKSN